MGQEEGQPGRVEESWGEGVDGGRENECSYKEVGVKRDVKVLEGEPRTFYHVRDIKGRHTLIVHGHTQKSAHHS